MRCLFCGESRKISCTESRLFWQKSLFCVVIVAEQALNKHLCVTNLAVPLYGLRTHFAACYVIYSDGKNTAKWFTGAFFSFFNLHRCLLAFEMHRRKWCAPIDVSPIDLHSLWMHSAFIHLARPDLDRDTLI